ncbi:MAG: efflux RND transporter periplasmic adaptor subunit [Burkholderiales bacterium]
MNKITVAIIAAIALAAGAYGGYRYAQSGMAGSHAGVEPARNVATQAVEGDAGKRVLYWFDPMFPQQKFDQPGKSPFMDMQLVPKYAEAGADEGTVVINPRVVQNLGVRTAEASLGALERRFDAVGTVAWNERAVVQLQARAAGFVERLHARAPLDAVGKGAPLVELLIPEWTGAQEEYLVLLASESPEAPALARAARQRLVLLGMSEAEIAAIARTRRVRQKFTLVSPIAGVIAELGVREGGTVAPGQTLYRIVDLATVWVNAEIPEAQAGMVVPGSKVQARVPAYPDHQFLGRIGAILPEVSAATRTVRARIEMANHEGLLKPGMFATLRFASGNAKEHVLVPSEALIRTGTRNVVILALGEGRFRAADVEVGQEGGGRSEILKGLAPGDRVVLSSQFLIDSEASLSAAISRLLGGDESPPAPLARSGRHAGRGKVTEVKVAESRVELDHGPMPSIQWPAMRMGFKVADPRQLEGLEPGDEVAFELRGEPDPEGNYVIERITGGAGK